MYCRCTCISCVCTVDVYVFAYLCIVGVIALAQLGTIGAYTHSQLSTKGAYTLVRLRTVDKLVNSSVMSCRQVGDTLCIRQSAVLPDRFFIDGAKDIPMSDPLPSPAEAKHGDWNYNETTGKITYYSKRFNITTVRCIVSLKYCLISPR